MKKALERWELAAGNIALHTVGQVREILFRFSDEDPEFKRYLLGRHGPDDAECVSYLIDRLKAAEDKT